ncbi:PAAR domain-containing protein [Burkholderia cepacia]|uniref:PAAR domain-containing protein n=1 Tax=Burkholderia cepacia TaxID=292 RepID=UPI001CF0ED3A|nr:PAAR domain-containing protein [Burkholderia cepacia]
MKAIVRKGDLTDHGGVVLAGFSGADFSGGPAAGPGHMVSCPKWGGMPGSPPRLRALHAMSTVL